MEKKKGNMKKEQDYEIITKRKKWEFNIYFNSHIRNKERSSRRGAVVNESDWEP